MNHDSIATPNNTRAILEKHGFSFKKSLGQHFLIDMNILRKIVSAAELDAQSAVLEIGPGIGALTEQLAHMAGKVVAVEIDQRLIPILQELMSPYPHVQIVHGDILRTHLPTLFAEHFADFEHVHVVANLPYYITTPIILTLLDPSLPIQNIIVMIQKEVAERMAANPGGKDYGSLSIAVQYHCEVEMITTVPQTVFVPPPHVDSAVIRLRKRAKPPVNVDDEQHFFKVVQAAFARRRKTLFNNLRTAFFPKGPTDELRVLLEQCAIDPSRRGETLSMEEFARLSNALRMKL